MRCAYTQYSHRTVYILEIRWGGLRSTTCAWLCSLFHKNLPTCKWPRKSFCAWRLWCSSTLVINLIWPSKLLLTDPLQVRPVFQNGILTIWTITNQMAQCQSARIDRDTYLANCETLKSPTKFQFQANFFQITTVMQKQSSNWADYNITLLIYIFSQQYK